MQNNKNLTSVFYISNSNKKAFTLIELIVVMTIIVILGTVGFISYTGYIATSRDATRVSQIQMINQGFNSYTTGRPPLPDDKVTIYASGVIIGYQGNVGENVLSILGINEGGKDPYDNNYYTYFIDAKQRNIQLLTFLEDSNNLDVSYNGLVNQVKADYTNRIPKPYGSKLGVLVETGSNAPIQDNIALRSSGIDIVNTTNSYKAYFTDDIYLYGTGLILQKIQQSIINNGVGLATPASCPDGFIGVPGNIEFNQPGFCVMKYEATYVDATVPDSTGGGTDWNTMHYQSGKTIVSRSGLYPIADITQQQAIDACKSMGDGSHLITNDEWMTIARNIEQVGNNWSLNAVGSGGLFRGITGETNSSTSLGCATSNSTGNHTRTYASTSLSLDTIKWGSNKQSDCDSKRQHILSNGEIIWDLSGNVWEHVNKANTLDGTNYSLGQTSVAGSSTGVGWDTDGIYDISDMKKYGSSLGLGMANGMGSLWYASGSLSNIFVRGDAVGDATRAGVFTMGLFRTSSNQYCYIGFRCAK